ncbi:ligase-associated DNA damage response endonuclease PdeM [Rubellimicrobium sp. CFH 75288]|uniref:ligase-associated DNA damage response endonuclease PdeM n=1 Tax=Rubellimicrobium sp. CFH 75288 TaxID=2697034 RepID=UPI0014128A23|nr:ligase-associated DNA damage response endonuclease PdeM [Rubellimicrobium sp. CFH 75288]NAZ36678.1 ligase-associated DNA damage response endonuclease PdeM [Rubellimicrobium sp. CFH 75288]
MNGTAHSLVLHRTHCLLLASGALFVPEADLLCVADLHLGRSERAARRGGPLLPPYETRATLERLEEAVALAKPATVVALGDSFDDDAAAHALDPGDRARLLALAEGRRWVWVAGNHDPGSMGAVPEWRGAGLVFRHEARAGAEAGEVSGHFHPKAACPGLRGRRPCFVTDGRRLILPAFGAYTGGLDTADPDLRALFADRAIAVLTGHRALAVPLPPARRCGAGG